MYPSLCMAYTPHLATSRQPMYFIRLVFCRVDCLLLYHMVFVLHVRCASGRAYFIRLAKIEISCRLKHRQASWDNNESGIMGGWESYCLGQQWRKNLHSHCLVNQRYQQTLYFPASEFSISLKDLCWGLYPTESGPCLWRTSCWAMLPPPIQHIVLHPSLPVFFLM